jgi:EAL domain-containing protein (putative c-di-GMP-specific phosphodiesterase class I)
VEKGAPTKSAAFLDVLAQRQFRVVYQPVVDLASGKVFSYEALLRSGNPAFSSPPELLNAAVAQNAMGQFGRIIRERTIEDAPETALFINIHPAELGDGWLVRPDDPIFERADDVYLEITESVPLTHFDLCHGILAEVRSRGVKLAVDDLGSGYSNLKYIADLSPEVVKIDRDLIANMHTSRRQQILVAAIVRLCSDLGARVVAEGIETLDELRASQDAGAQFGQGYLLARPGFPAPAVPWPPRNGEPSTPPSGAPRPSKSAL